MGRARQNVLFESKGELTIMREPGDGSPDPELVRIGLRNAADFPQRGRGPASFGATSRRR